MNSFTHSGVSGRCVRSFNVQLVNRSCASLTWSLFANCSTPDFMVVQWFSRRHQGSGHHRRLHGEDTWARLPYTDSPAYLPGNSASTHHLQAPAPTLGLKDVVSPPQGKSLMLKITSICTRCLRTERGSRFLPQVAFRGYFHSSLHLTWISFLIILSLQPKEERSPSTRCC